MAHRCWPDQSRLVYGGHEFLLDLRELRRAWVRRQLVGELMSEQELAAAAGASRSTISRLLAGKQVSLPIVRAVLDEVRLEVTQVLVPAVLSESQRDGRACVWCANESTPKIPAGTFNGGTVFKCEPSCFAAAARIPGL